ncbi:diaminopimelate decarboxylase [Halobacillus kuroshimensis]|uniref:Diaminopimelate decarboxylase n=1 Tax=Halobacillus kuroshimensis TaxID=302481 RepID=A0ABS3DTR0_9BACI|nr:MULTISPECIES: diaminopimelate decarboxylase [Halobacillus]MBN8234748.1 diaminopimelate decarboxylase [Halobacillus kuroshimensis]
MNHEVNEQGQLMIAGVPAKELAHHYGTPLFVYDVDRIRANAQAFVRTFEEYNVPAQVAYASKAFSSTAILQVAHQEGLSLDVVSQGELHTALEAGFPVEKIHMHGNNKNIQEIEMAVRCSIGCIVVDNFFEIELLSAVLKEQNKTMDVLLRVTPGIEAHTHDYILTGQEDSKFGFDLSSGQAEEAFLKVKEDPNIQMKGLHCHIGSQIFETDGFQMAAQRLFRTLHEWKETYYYEASVVNLGGGFGIQYTEEDQPLELDQYAHALIKEVKALSRQFDYPMPEIWIEPGRAIVGEAGTTLYTVGSVKNIPDVRTYISVDGGMTDNIRPALYNAKYEAALTEKMKEPAENKYSIAGKCCESGDMLIWDVALPAVEHGDTLAVFSTGAYGYAMASNYNRFQKPAVVFVENGEHQLVVQRESYQDMTRLDLSYEKGKGKEK